MAAAADVANLIVSLRLDDSGFSGKLNAAAGQLKAMDAGLSQMSRGAGQVTQGIGKLATVTGALAVGGLGAVVKTAASFEQAWAGVVKTVEGTPAELSKLEEGFKNLSRTVPLSFEELAAIGAEGGALGIATDDLLDFTDIVARLAVSTDLTADQASTALGQLGNILKLSSGDMRDFGDALVALGNDGASTESQILDMAARFGAAGKAAGLSNEEILALASTTASMGIEAEAGGGALSRIFNNLTLDMATASSEGELLADTLGYSLGELKTAWDRDAGGVFRDLLGHISKLDQFEAAEFLSDLGITNTRDINAIRNLSAGFEEYNRQLGVAEGQTNELNKESDAFFNTTEGKWEILKNNVRLAADTIGGELLPVVNEVMGDLVEWLSDPKVQAGLKDFATDLAGGVKGLIQEIKTADFGPLIETLKGAAGIAKAGFDAFNALPSGVKSLALAAFGINKLSGGALGDIAKGFGNIFAGGLKILFERGASPANPMWVQTVGGGLGGAGGPVAGGKGGGPLGGALRLLAPLAAAGIAQEFEDEITGLGQDIHEGFLADNPLAGFSLNDLEWPFGNKNAPDWARFDEAPSGEGSRSRGGSFGPTAADGSFDRVGEKLDKLATTEVIEHLARTNEMGLKGVGTTFQVGLSNGLDPLGDIATSILARAEDPKSPPVMAEIQGHLAGLEEIQAAYLANGDVNLANKVQTNIDTLHSLIGTTDSTRAVIEAMSAAAASSDAAMIQTAGRTTAEVQALNMNEGSRAAVQHGLLSSINAKNFSPTVNVTTNVDTFVTLHEFQRQASSSSRAYDSGVKVY